MSGSKALGIANSAAIDLLRRLEAGELVAKKVTIERKAETVLEGQKVWQELKLEGKATYTIEVEEVKHGS